MNNPSQLHWLKSVSSAYIDARIRAHRNEQARIKQYNDQCFPWDPVRPAEKLWVGGLGSQIHYGACSEIVLHNDKT